MSRRFSSYLGAALCVFLLAALPHAAMAAGAQQNNGGKTRPYTLNFTGNTHFSEKQLLQAAAEEVKMFEQHGLRKADIDDAAFRMRSAYHQAGFAFATVEYDYRRQNEKVEASFTVAEGPRVVLEKVIFSGNDRVGTETLFGFFPQTRGVGGTTPKIFFVESGVRSALGKVRDYYRGEGFVDVQVGGPELAFSGNRTGVTVTVPISEGTRYLVSEVVLRGDLPEEIAAELEGIRKEFAGIPYHARRRLLLRTELESAYDSIGFAHAAVEVEAVLEKTGKTTLTADIASGEKIRIRDVLVSGNARIREAFILRRLELEPGDIYTNKGRMESFRSLYDTGLFSRVEIGLLQPRIESGTDLEVQVEELPTREYYIEPGWGSYEQARLRAGVLEKNLFGTGRNGRLETLVSVRAQNLTVSYTDPWLLQSNISMNIPLVYDRREEPSYTSEEISLSTIFSRKLNRNLSLSAGYQYRITDLYSLSKEADLPGNEEDYSKGAIAVQLVWDSRDDIFYPTSGLRLAGSLDISLPALGSDLEFGRITLGSRYFIKVKRDYIIGLRATAGLIVPFGEQDYIPISERFFNGGDTTVRSFEHSELGPQDASGEPVGGLGYTVFSIELRKRLYRNFAAALYVDAGNISPNRSLLARDFAPYSESGDLLDDTLKDFFSSFSYGVGMGFQYLLPVGPVRLDVAWNPDPDRLWGEASWVYHFSLGMAF